MRRVWPTLNLPFELGLCQAACVLAQLAACLAESPQGQGSGQKLYVCSSVNPQAAYTTLRPAVGVCLSLTTRFLGAGLSPHRFH
jgi:hypothetical protein